MRQVLVACVAAATLALLLVVPVLAAHPGVFAADPAPLPGGPGLFGGCTMELRAFDGDNATGFAVDQAAVSGPIEAGTPGSSALVPFDVNPEGSVDFAFHTGSTVFANNHWQIFAAGFPVPILAGSDDNPLDVDETGIVSLNGSIKALPFRVVGVFDVSGDLWGNNDTAHCRGEGYVKVLGDPVGTIPFDVAAALIVLSGLMLLVATPYSTTWETDPNAGEKLHSGPINS
jgi:hypothetical protein